MIPEEFVKSELNQAAELLTKVLNDQGLVAGISRAGEILSQAFKSGNKVISCGNGGSMADAIHFAEELSGKFRLDRKALPAMAISDPAFLSCAANDYGYDKVFSRFIEGHGNSGDVLLAISTSGNSANIIAASAEAQKKGMKIIALSGNDGGSMKNYADLNLTVPFFGYADRIQEVHIKIIHILIALVERDLFSHHK